MKRLRLHRTTFVMAGVYNLAWGAFSVIHPQAVFEFAGMKPLNYPEVWQCLGMVVGLYGIAYLEVARKPQQGQVIAAIGLAGKVLGPAGALALIMRPENPWPWQFGLLNMANDVIWWLPFGMYLWDARAGASAPVTEIS